MRKYHQNKRIIINVSVVKWCVREETIIWPLLFAEYNSINISKPEAAWYMDIMAGATVVLWNSEYVGGGGGGGA